MRDYSDNAVMAKTRTLYGRGLKAGDYDALIHLKSVAEVAGYLKNNTCYAGILGEVKEELVHRGQLENLIRRRNLQIYTRLLKYSYQDKFFLMIYIMENEVRQLLLAIRFLNAGSMDRYIVALPVYISKYMSFDLFALAKAGSYDDILELTAHSGYYGILSKFRPPAAGMPVDITACEKALLEYYYRTVLARVEKDFSGDTREMLTGMLHTRIDYHNLSVAYRLKRFFHYKPGDVRAHMLDVKTGLNFARAFDRLLNASGEAEINEALRDAYVSGKFRINWDEGSDQAMSVRLERGRMSMVKREFRFTAKPMVAAISFLFMLDIEVGNIVKIIEGIRYRIPPEEIRGMLAL